MKRSPLVTAVNLIQTLLGLLLVGITVYLIALTRSHEILAEPDSADTIHGLLIGALVLGIPAVITLIAAAGLWKGKFWGWALSLATDVGMVAVLVYSIADDNDADGTSIALIVGFLVPLLLLLLPGVRAIFWSKVSPKYKVTVSS